MFAEPRRTSWSTSRVHTPAKRLRRTRRRFELTTGPLMYEITIEGLPELLDDQLRALELAHLKVSVPE